MSIVDHITFSIFIFICGLYIFLGGYLCGYKHGRKSQKSGMNKKSDGR